MDKISKDRRSKNMAAINSQSTRPEKLVRKILSSSGVKYRCNVKTLPGRPDIAIKKYRLALNVHGCFWHGHSNCKQFRIPKTNQAFWRKKISDNKKGIKKNKLLLEEAGYRYFEIWECELKQSNFRTIEKFIRCYKDCRDID